MRTSKESFVHDNRDGYGYGVADTETKSRCLQVDELRKHEFPQLQDAVYLDHAGTTLYTKSQLQRCVEELQGGSVLGNPHSQSPLHAAASSDGSTLSGVAAMRRRVLAFANASESEYAVVFTSGATAALKMVGECFPWSAKSTFAHAMDAHTSVLGMRRYASDCGANVVNVPLQEMQQLEQTASASASRSTCTTSGSTMVEDKQDPEQEHDHTPFHLFAFPGECNFSGTLHSLDLVPHIQRHGYQSLSLPAAPPSPPGRWLVLVDAAKFAATHPLDLGSSSSWRPDFVALSFYKLFGYPSGIGALLVHRQRALPLLQKRYYGGGTVATISATRGDLVKLRPSTCEARLEDGTLAFLSILSLRHGLDVLEKLTMRAVESHTAALTALLRAELTALHHWNKTRVCQLYGAVEGLTTNSSITSFNFVRADGSFVGYAEVGKLAAIHGIHIRTGCFCNPGACQWYLGLSDSDVDKSMAAGHVCGDDVDLVDGKPTGAVRVSLGYMTTYEDVAAWIAFATKYFVACVAPPPPVAPLSVQLPTQSNTTMVLRKLVLFPIKSCVGMSVEAWPVGSRGLLYDREWAILDASTRRALTLKDAPQLCFLIPIVDLKQQTLTIQWRHESSDSNSTGSSFSLPLSATLLSKSIATAKHQDVQQMRVCAAQCTGRDVGDAASQWLSEKLQRACRLVRVAAESARSASGTAVSSPSSSSSSFSSSKIGFANQAQFLLISRASVAHVNASLCAAGAAMELHEDAFRANLVVDSHAPETDANQNQALAFAEDAWTQLRIGDVLFDVTGPCARCSMINIDPQTGAFHRAPLQVLSRYRRERSQILFGQFLALRSSSSSSSLSSSSSSSFSRSSSSSSASSSSLQHESSSFAVPWLRCGTHLDMLK